MSRGGAIDVAAVVVQVEELVSSSLIDGEIVVTSIDAGSYYALDPVASRIWKLIAKPVAVAEICDIIVTEYDVERTQCERDVIEHLNRLTDYGLVRTVHETATG
ncbi:PqqD family peptide modification chaperone [Verrucomicrobiota bacterium]